MNNLRIFTILFLSFLHYITFAQAGASEKTLYFELRQLHSSNTWGIFISPGEGINPSERTSTGTGQVTIVTPVDFQYTDLKNYSGTWSQNARVDSPAEAPGNSYISFGFEVDMPKIRLLPKQETLLFTFTAVGNQSAKISLFNNESDPFAAPNSYSSNPGNDFGMIDFGADQGYRIYVYASNIENESSFNRDSAKAVMAVEKEKKTAEDKHLVKMDD
jgi:hypothetical protein